MSPDSSNSASADSGSVYTEFKLYHYKPSLAAAVLFAIAFAVISIRHLQLLIQKRTWCFIPFLIGCLFEAVGFGARAYSSTQTPDWSLPPYMAQTMLILLAPVFYAASIYMVLSRLMRVLDGQDYSLIQLKWLTKLFLIGDVLSIFAQAGGGGLVASASDKSTQDLGNNVILMGLGIQVVFFSGFMVVSAVFHIRISRGPTVRSRMTDAPWRRFIWVLYLVSMLILVRSIFRMVEYAQGHDGSLIKKEIYVYVLDALLMLIVAVVFNFSHPGTVLVQHKIFDSGVDYDHWSHSYGMARR